MWKDFESSKYFLAAAFGFFGSIVHATNQLRIARKNKEKFTIRDGLILFPIALFSGLVFGLLSQLVSNDPVHLMLSVSTGSFLGIVGLNKAADIFLAVLLRAKGADYERE